MVDAWRRIDCQLLVPTIGRERKEENDVIKKVSKIWHSTYILTNIGNWISFHCPFIVSNVPMTPLNGSLLGIISIEFPFKFNDGHQKCNCNFVGV